MAVKVCKNHAYIYIYIYIYDNLPQTELDIPNKTISFFYDSFTLER